MQTVKSYDEYITRMQILNQQGHMEWVRHKGQQTLQEIRGNGNLFPSRIGTYVQSAALAIGAKASGLM